MTTRARFASIAGAVAFSTVTAIIYTASPAQAYSCDTNAQSPYAIGRIIYGNASDSCTSDGAHAVGVALQHRYFFIFFAYAGDGGAAGGTDAFISTLTDGVPAVAPCVTGTFRSQAVARSFVTTVPPYSEAFSGTADINCPINIINPEPEPRP